MKHFLFSTVFFVTICVTSSLNAQVPDEFVKAMAEQSASMACRAEKQLDAYKVGYLEALDCISKHDKEYCREILSRDGEPKAFMSTLDLSSCSKTVALSD